MTSLYAINAILITLSILVLLPIATFCVECVAAVLRRLGCLDLFESLDEPTRQRAIGALRRRLDALTPDQLVYRPPVVSIVARKP